MEQEINNFVKNVRMLMMAEGDVTLLKYSIVHDDKNNILPQVERIENILHIANDSLVEAIRNSLNSQQENNFEPSEIVTAISLIKALQESALLNKAELVEMLEPCLTSFREKNFTDVLNSLKQNQEVFRKQIISLQDICAERFQDF